MLVYSSLKGSQGDEGEHVSDGQNSSYMARKRFVKDLLYTPYIAGFSFDHGSCGIGSVPHIGCRKKSAWRAAPADF